MKQEKYNKEVIALLVIIIVILLALIVLLATGTVSFKSSSVDNNQSSKNLNDNISNLPASDTNTKEDLTSSELDELNTYFNETANSQMAFVIFDNPSKLLEKDNNHNYSYLSYIISRSKYAEDLKQEHVPSYSITLSGIKNVLKDLTNYDYTEEEIKNYFNSLYNSEKDSYVILGGGAGMIGTITDSYKINNTYYITLSNKANIVLQKVNNQYYFYSSTGTDK